MFLFFKKKGQCALLCHRFVRFFRPGLVQDPKEHHSGLGELQAISNTDTHKLFLSEGFTPYKWRIFFSILSSSFRFKMTIKKSCRVII